MVPVMVKKTSKNEPIHLEAIDIGCPPSEALLCAKCDVNGIVIFELENAVAALE